MKRKRFNHYADVIGKMFMGWRMADDLETLADVPDGTLVLNLLEQTATHNKAGSIDLHITREIHAWLKHECERESIDFNLLKTARLTVAMTTSRVKTDKKKVVCFSFDCHTLIETDEATYSSEAKETHKWHNRKPQPPGGAYVAPAAGAPSAHP